MILKKKQERELRMVKRSFQFFCPGLAEKHINSSMQKKES
jgi:hypothetical protein